MARFIYLLLALVISAAGGYFLFQYGFAPSAEWQSMPPQYSQSEVAADANKEAEGGRERETIATTTTPTSSAQTPKIIIATTTPPEKISIKNLPPVTEKISTQTSSTSNTTGTSAGAESNSIQTTIPARNLPPSIDIEPRTIVGLLCSYNIEVKDSNGRILANGETMAKGSGVIISPDGKILTNRHVIQRDSEQDSATVNGKTVSGTFSYTLKECLAGQAPEGTSLPTPAEIRSINPTVRITVLPYKTSLIETSSGAGLSDLEKKMADFALLKINGLSPDAPTFGYNSLPGSFPYAKILPADNNVLSGDQVLTFGFPGDITQARNDAFGTMYLAGSVGSIKKVYVGDLYYTETPLVITTEMEIYHGRSGSPLFWRGYVVGLVTAYSGNDSQENRTESISVASDAILKDFGNLQ